MPRTVPAAPGRRQRHATKCRLGGARCRKEARNAAAVTARSALLFFAHLTYGAYRIGLPWRRLSFTGSTSGPTEPHGNQDRSASGPGTRSGPPCRSHPRYRATARTPALAPGPLAGGPGGGAVAGRRGRRRVVPDPPPGGHRAGWRWRHGRCPGHRGRSGGAGRRRAGLPRRTGHGHASGYGHAAAPGVGGADRGALQGRPDGHQGSVDGADRPPALPAGADAGPGHPPTRRGPTGERTHHPAALPDPAGAGLHRPPGRGHPGRAGAPARRHGDHRPRGREDRPAQPGFHPRGGPRGGPRGPAGGGCGQRGVQQRHGRYRRHHPGQPHRRGVRGAAGPGARGGRAAGDQPPARYGA